MAGLVGRVVDRATGVYCDLIAYVFAQESTQDPWVDPYPDPPAVARTVPAVDGGNNTRLSRTATAVVEQAMPPTSSNQAPRGRGGTNNIAEKNSTSTWSVNVIPSSLIAETVVEDGATNVSGTTVVRAAGPPPPSSSEKLKNLLADHLQSCPYCALADLTDGGEAPPRPPPRLLVDSLRGVNSKQTCYHVEWGKATRRTVALQSTRRCVGEANWLRPVCNEFLTTTLHRRCNVVVWNSLQNPKRQKMQRATWGGGCNEVLEHGAATLTRSGSETHPETVLIEHMLLQPDICNEFGAGGINMQRVAFPRTSVIFSRLIHSIFWLWTGAIPTCMHCEDYGPYKRGDPLARTRRFRVPADWIFPLVDCEMEHLKNKFCPRQTKKVLEYLYGRDGGSSPVRVGLSPKDNEILSGNCRVSRTS